MKMKVVLYMLLAAFLLSGCSNNQEVVPEISEVATHDTSGEKSTELVEETKGEEVTEETTVQETTNTEQEDSKIVPTVTEVQITEPVTSEPEAETESAPAYENILEVDEDI